MNPRLKKLLEMGPGPEQCHPKVGRVRPAGGCLPRQVLEEAAKEKGIPVPKQDKALRTALEKAVGMKSGADVAEYSFLMALPLPSPKKAELAAAYLRPPMPPKWRSDPDMWLDSNDIKNVMAQHEEANPRFDFMGPFPIDFAAADPYAGGAGGGKKRCLMNEMCELHVKDAKKNGKDYIGIIYNLDPHYKSGSHWVANFIDLKKNTCHYFDSYGQAPPDQVQIFMKWMKVQDPNMQLFYNSRRLQYKNTECGMFCLMFIIFMQYGVDFLEIIRALPRDEHMLDLRDWIFST